VATGCQPERQASHGRGREERIERRLQEQRFVEGKQPGQRREARRQPGGAEAEPFVGGEMDERDGASAKHDLHEPHGGKGMRDGEDGGQKVDVERRQEIQARAESRVAGEDAFGEPDVGRRVETCVGLRQHMILQLQHHREFQRKGSGEQDEEQTRA